MSAESALAAAPNEPQNDAANEAEVEVKSEEEVAKNTAAANAAEEATAAVHEALTPALSQGETEKATERILNAEGLPPGMRERLASVAAASSDAKLPVDGVVKAIEDSLPEFLRANRGAAAPMKHPAGEVFFRGDTGTLKWLVTNLGATTPTVA